MTEATEDTGNALQGDPTDVVIEAATEAVAVVEATESTETIAKQPKQEELELGQAKESKDPDAWKMKRLHEETNKRYAVEEQLAQERRKTEEFRSLVERLQADKETPAHQRREEVPDIQPLVQAEAKKIIFDNDCNDVANAWRSENPAFSDRLGILQAAGVMPAKDGSNTDFLMDIIAIDKPNAHKILDSLASDPDRAIALSRMDSRRRVAELTRMTMADAVKPVPAAPKPAAISKVPAPKPVLEAIRAAEEVAEDDMTDAQWSAWRKKQMAKTG